GTSTLRATGTFSTGRTVRFGNTTNTRAIEVTQGNVLTLTSPFDLTGGAGAVLVKNDNGVVTLDAANPTWTGGITVNAGAVRLTNNTGAGTGTIVVGPGAVGAALQLVGGVTVSNPLSLQPTANVLLGGLNFGGQLQSVSGVNTYTGLITLGFDAAIGADTGSTLNINGGIVENAATNHQLIFAASGDINLNSAITASGGAATGLFGLQKYGNGTLSISSVNAVTISDATGFRINGGTVLFKGAGTWAGSFTSTTGNFVLNPGGTLTLDNSAAAGGNVNNRLGTTRVINFLGGNLNLIGNEAANTIETFAAPTLSRGLSVINVTAKAGFQTDLLFTGAATNPSTLQNVTSNTPTGASILFRGTNLGSAAGAGNATIRNSGGFAFAGLLAGATGATNKAIMPYALVENTTTGAISFATGDAAANATTTTAVIRPLAAAEYAANNTLTTGTNINLTSGNTPMASSTSVNSLTMAGDSTLTAADSFRVLTNSSGGILVKSGSSTISGGVISQTAGTVPLNVWTVGNLTITSVLHGGNGTANGNIGFVKAGAQTLTISSPTTSLPFLPGHSANSYSGQFVLNQGTVVLNGGKNTIQANNFLALEGGVLNLNGNSQMVNGFFTTGGVNGAGGILTSATPATFVNNADNATRNFAGSIQGSIYFNRSGQGTMSYYTANTYTGATLINGGTTILRDNASFSGTSSVDINYATLSLDNNVGTIDMANRLNDTASITLRGGTLTVQGRAQMASSEALGAVSVVEGFNVINSLPGGTGVNSIDVSLASLSRAAGSSATLIIQGTNLGTIGSNSRVTAGAVNGVPTNAGSFSSNGGGLTNNMIGGWAVTNANEFLTYTPLGFTGLGQVGAPQYDYTNVIPAGNFSTRNVRLSSTTAVPNGGTIVNALSMSGSNIALTFTTATDTLNL
ncbi:MAG TPA: hypothetical protein VD994_04105, partial [Prosthecobacter sp.]|nr:hypothetical protein [Prosthecobacter sp.]